jgi:hypothetical protein
LRKSSASLSSPLAAAGENLTNPFLGQPDAIAAGRVIYARKCYVCHHSSGARGPNLFAMKLSDERFLETGITVRVLAQGTGQALDTADLANGPRGFRVAPWDAR